MGNNKKMGRNTSSRKMGSTMSTRRMGSAIDNLDDITLKVESPPKTFLDFLKELEQKKDSVRENALSSIIQILNSRKEHQSLQNNFATFLYRILDLIKRGSAKVKQLASHALGLLAMALCDTDNVQEIYRESLPALTKALSETSKKADPWAFITLLNSLAMITFFCATNTEETEAAMQMIWEFILPAPKLDVCRSKLVPAVISAAVTAWSFLLSTVVAWELNHRSWQGAISQFLPMLEADDESVYVAAGEALAVMFNCESLNKFFKDEDPMSSSKPLKYSERKSVIKDKIVKQIEKLSMKARNEISLQQTFSNAARPDWDVLKYFENDNFPPTSLRIYGHKLTLSSWPQMIQLKFFKNFLGEEEFAKHMLENELFHYLFDFTPIYKEDSGPELYESTMVKIAPLIFLPEEQGAALLTRKEVKQEWLWRNSIINKAKTKMLNKRRMYAQERKGKTYHIESEL